MGRITQLVRCTGALDAAQRARSSVLVVRGDCGSGKTALVGTVAGEARDRGFTVTRTTGLAFERHLPLAGLHALIAPLLDLVPAGADAATLASAFAPAPGPIDDLGTLQAVLAVVRSAAAVSPVLMVVDDVHWLDDASLRALLFVAYRLDAERAVMIFTARPDLGSLLDATSLEELVLADLDPGSTVELLGRHGVAPAVARLCHERTGGNPLSLLKAAGALTPAQRTGKEELPRALPLDDRILERFLPLLDGQAESARRALEVAALDTEVSLPILVDALAVLGVGAEALEAPIDAGLLRVDGHRVDWPETLLLSIVRRETPTDRRLAAHRALAEILTPTDPGRAIWHLAESALGTDEALAASLEQRGHQFYARRNLDTAAFAFERASRLSPEGSEAVRRMLLAASARWSEDATSVVFRDLEELAHRVASDRQRAEVDALLGRVEMLERGSHLAIRRFEAAAARIADTDPAMAAKLLLQRSAAHLLSLDSEASFAATTEARALAVKGDDVPVEMAAIALGVIAAVFDGCEPPVPEPGLASVVAGAIAAMDGEIDTGSMATEAVQLGAIALMASDRTADALAAVDRVINLSEADGMRGRARLARLIRSEVLWRTGRWAESLAEARRARSMVEVTGAADGGTITLACLARVEAGLGWAEDCRRHAQEAITLNVDRGLALGEAWARAACGLLALGHGDHQEAADQLDAVALLCARMRAPGWLWWEGDAIEALFHCRRRREAEERLAELSRSAARSSSRWAQAVATRSAVLLGVSDGDADADLGAALAVFRSIGAPFEEARTLLLRGERREVTGGAAAEDLREASAIFARLGARPWVERATRSPRTSGEAALGIADRLSPAEVRVALAVASGATNREAAGQLYLSVKTVEFHLQSIYRKLGIRRRAQLASAIAAESTPGREPCST